MEEKKLTDEEIVKALECCVKNQCGGCCPAWTLETDIECQYYISELAVDLIHRLQSENERLNDMKFTQEHCDLYKENELLKTELSKELAEHEEFTKKAKAEVERLTEAHKKDTMLLYASGLACEQVKAENAELQKQVDELKDICLDCPYKLKFDEIEKQTVKDTVKEILTELIERAHSNGCIDLTVNEVKAWFREDYGVEVRE